MRGLWGWLLSALLVAPPALCMARGWALQRRRWPSTPSKPWLTAVALSGFLACGLQAGFLVSALALGGFGYGLGFGSATILTVVRVGTWLSLVEIAGTALYTGAARWLWGCGALWHLAFWLLVVQAF